jgi:hypothetical protein
MCLEDRLLLALYSQTGPVPLAQLSNSILITHNAGQSIVNRVCSSFPHYILVESKDGEDGLLLAANREADGEVRRFLADGGFTAINEQEFREYYQKELKREKRRELWRKLTSGQTWWRWMAGTGLTVAGGFAITAWMKSIKR